jgi:ferric-chelate reductase (NADPH)
MASVKKIFGDVVGKWLFRELTIAAIDEVAPRFRRFALVGEQLRGASFSAGDKVQVLLDAGFRTYTPFAFDAEKGAMSFLVYSHGDTPGSTWGREAKVGDRFRVFGPRGSLPLASWDTPAVIFGDETSFAVARALREHRGGPSSIRCVFEVSDTAAAAAALASLELRNVDVVERRPDDAHLGEAVARVRAALESSSGSKLAITGKAQSIQRLQRDLRANPVNHSGQKAKAYWAPGKRGLD